MLRPDQRNGLRQVARLLLLASACAFVISYFLRNRLPDKGAILPSLGQDPVQTGTDLPGPFDVTRKGVTYVVDPIFNYELWGMVSPITTPIPSWTSLIRCGMTISTSKMSASSGEKTSKPASTEG